MTLRQLVAEYPDAATARLRLEELRWPNGAECPHCGVVGEAFKLGGAAAKRGVWKCRACAKQFTVAVGTIFSDSKIPLDTWMIAFHLICANKKGISAHSMHRMLGLTYKSAWFMCHRIRLAMDSGTFDDPDGKLHGTVEMDETYVGGKAKNAHNGAPVPTKAAVVALVERNGRARAKKVADVDGPTVHGIISRHVRKNSRLMTDSAGVYHAAKGIIPKHDSVNHEAKEYVRGNVHTNTVESFNSLVKRSVIGAWHHVSEQHLDRYLAEVCFRWDWRKVEDGDRVEVALRQTGGKRLTYRALKSGAVVAK